MYACACIYASYALNNSGIHLDSANNFGICNLPPRKCTEILHREQHCSLNIQDVTEYKCIF